MAATPTREQANGHSAPATTSERVAERLREDIRSGRLAPGQRLVEAELTRRHEVSRGPVREALARLQSEGLVTIKPNRGASVRRMGRRELEELFWLRARLSGDAAGLAAKRVGAGEGEAAMREELVRQRSLRGAGLAPYTEANVRFHELIDRLSGNAALATVLRNLETHAGVFLHLASAGDTERLLGQHVAIAEAILAGDSRRAARRSRRHVETVLTTIRGLPDEWFDR
ncbi:MAG TPA: GntR family transcriptional regulator [Solirubrobacterales bacterium]|jgi:DNA-binding GntR family transcriptional regulator|nr:GntR family transcriptional regulator [Solirubrobacterales bacterium]